MGFIKTLKIFYRYYKPDRWKLVLGLVCLLSVDILVAIQPRILKWFVDQVSITFSGNQDYSPYVWIGLAYAAAAVGQGIFRYGWRMFIAKPSHRAAERIRADYFAKLQKLPPSFYDKRPIGDLMALGSNDIEAVRFALGPGLIVFADAVFLFIVLPPAMIMLSPKLTLFCLVPMLAIPFVVFWAEKLVHDRFNAVQAQFSKLSAFAQENIEGIRIVKAFVREWDQLKRFSNLGKEFVRLNLKFTKAEAIFDPLFFFSISLGLVSLLIFSGEDVIAGVVTIGTFVAFTRYLDQLAWPLMAFGLSVTWYQQGKSSMGRILEVLGEKEEVDTVPGVTTPHIKTDSKTLIEFKDLSFAYPNTDTPVLKNLNFKIQKGTRTALVGPIGSGKSTLVKLLCGLYEVPPGKMFFEGQDMTTIPLSERRDFLSVVPQDVFLFSETLGWNIALGEKAKEEHLYQLLDRAGLKQESMEWKLNQKIGEKGLNLSGGQRGRVSLARALYRAKAPLLILDDALSSVDSITESKILNGLQTHLREFDSQSMLMITHRLTRLWVFDQILVLKDGELVQMGKPAELATADGLFKKLLELQRFEDELAT